MQPPTASAEPTPQDVVEFNHLVKLLIEAGLPIGIGTTADPIQSIQLLESLDASVNANGNNTRSIDEIISTQIPNGTEYAECLRAWVASDRSIEAIDPLHELGILRAEMRASMAYGYIPLLLLAGLLLLGLVVLVSSIYPSLLYLYRVSDLEPTKTVDWLGVASRWLPYWSLVGSALLFIIGWRCWKAYHGNGFSWLPTSGASLESLQRVVAAERSALMISHGNELRDLPSSVRQEEVLSDQVGKEGRFAAVQSLQSLSRVHRQLLALRSDSWRRRWPILFFALFGGLLVLFYGLCLFWPMTELLYNLSKA
jgi:hypothetical protein